MARHPLTLLIAGHTHTYEHIPAYREIIVGNGGAPLIERLQLRLRDRRAPPRRQIGVTSYDYASHAVVDQFAILASGAAP